LIQKIRAAWGAGAADLLEGRQEAALRSGIKLGLDDSALRLAFEYARLASQEQTLQRVLGRD
jgi:hypothetical protein